LFTLEQAGSNAAGLLFDREVGIVTKKSGQITKANEVNRVKYTAHGENGKNRRNKLLKKRAGDRGCREIQNSFLKIKRTGVGKPVY
jgi:hypothetical protein